MNNKVIKSMKIEAEIPPPIPDSSYIPSSIAVIWIKDEYLPDYLTHEIWKYFTPIIRPLSMYDAKYIEEVGYTIGSWNF